MNCRVTHMSFINIATDLNPSRAREERRARHLEVLQLSLQRRA